MLLLASLVHHNKNVASLDRDTVARIVEPGFALAVLRKADGVHAPGNDINDKVPGGQVLRLRDGASGNQALGNQGVLGAFENQANALCTYTFTNRCVVLCWTAERIADPGITVRHVRCPAAWRHFTDINMRDSKAR
jgi:hypothetical protein